MKVLVIGSNSFTARSFINLCLRKNNNVIGVSRSKLYRNNDFDFSNRNFKFYRIDVNKKFEKLKSIINYYKPGIIINYTAQGEVRNSWKYPEHWYKTNFEFVFKLSNFLVEKKFLKKFIQISTP
jgi:dTDP-glucose 4,6-dehydratase